jgi:hypothetical protein
MVMTLRESFGGDVRRIHELVDALLDREDGVLALFDGGRVVTFAQGFGVSASQLELLSVELERALRAVVGTSPAIGNRRRKRHDRNQGSVRTDRVDGDGRGAVDGVLRLAGKVA